MVYVGLWKNTKSGNLYLVTGTRIDCTNSKQNLSNKHQCMVEYERNGIKYTRSYLEFIEKFTLVYSIN